MLEVLVVGAGPTGLLFAIWLKSIYPSVTVRIVSDATGIGTTSRAVVVQARTLEFYEQLGFVDQVLADGHIVKGPTIVKSGHILGGFSLIDAGKSQTRYPYAFAYPQEKHEALLAAKLHELGLDVEWQTKIVSRKVQQDGSMVVGLEKDDGAIESVRTRYLIGCDGHASFVRKSMDVRMLGDTYGQLFFVADLKVESNQSLDKIYISTTGAENYFILALDKDRARLIGALTDGEDDFVFEDHRQQVEERFGIHVLKVQWSSVYRVHHRVAEHFQVGHSFILGDAAHLHSPVGGQGMNTGLGDASNLAWKIAMVLQGQISADVLKTYEQERMPFAISLVKTTDRIFTLVTSKGLVSWFGREIMMPKILPVLWRLPALRNKAFRTVSQLAIEYRSSPLSVSEHAEGGVRAGDRLPWVEISGIDNYTSLGSKQFQFHIYGDSLERQEIAGIPVVQYKSTDKSRKAGLAADAIYLVRPDGYVAYVGRVSDTQAAEQYTQRWSIQLKRSVTANGMLQP